MKPVYRLSGDEFIISDYNNAKTFSSFLPGVAGLDGKPMWVFYVNRGQCISAFGTKDKDGAIMEFFPANNAYSRTSLDGFRTFIKIDENTVYEPFKLSNTGRQSQEIGITPYELRLTDVSPKNGIKTDVVYFTIPGAGYPALARMVTFENISDKGLKLKIVDGMPKILPYGMNGFFTKQMSRTIEAWMEAEGVPDRTPFFRLRVNAADVSKVEYIKSGNFFVSISGKDTLNRVIVDPASVFGNFSDFTLPGSMLEDEFAYPKWQRTKNITPSAFAYSETTLKKGGVFSICTLIGYAQTENELKKIASGLDREYFETKRAQNKSVTMALASSNSVFSSSGLLDAYVRQSNLDNILRGGYPLSCGGGKVIYMYNRKHGDLERDYNNFSLSPEKYSQGNGSFRDTNQNRRNSVWLNPETGGKDIKDFYDLIQLDGYNPLVIKGEMFTIVDEKARAEICAAHFDRAGSKQASEFLAGEFTIADAVRFIDLKKVDNADACFLDIIKAAHSSIDAEHGEGYWIDHWTYNLDIVESYLQLFPEKLKAMLLDEKDYRFFDNAHVVKPRGGRYVNADGVLRQYNSVAVNKEKEKLIASRKTEKNWVRVNYGKGHVYKSSLAVKMLTIIVNKIATLDARGLGVEMEADKPGWCDSLNGLPGIFGSSISETAELLKTVRFLATAWKALPEIQGVYLPVELSEFIEGIHKELKIHMQKGANYSSHKFWDRSNAAKESYREKVLFGVSGKEKEIKSDDLRNFLLLCENKLKHAIEDGPRENGVPYTYFVNDAVCHGKGHSVEKFKARSLPLSLEGAMRVIKAGRSSGIAKNICDGVKKSGLYDRKLKMYKLNVSLKDESLEIGRSRVFTPGWLENESVFLHMEYKYLLEMLKSGLAEEFYSDFWNALVPFFPPERYGRSVLENSSFIASSAFFDENLHGTGFVARLSGATAELLDMLKIMNLGMSPFVFENRRLSFKPEPVLDKALFTSGATERDYYSLGRKVSVKLPENSYSFLLFNKTLVTYINPKMKNTFGRDKVSPVEFVVVSGASERVITGGALEGSLASDLRKGELDALRITLG